MKMVTVYTASGQPEAEIIKGRLESNGIQAVLKYESAGIVFGLIIDGLGQVEVQVPADMAQKAKALLGMDNKE
ncbi:MAG: DUF2007 domain-containing protein [Chloroflexi bacterium]|nr:DUF2007 domain-containing protein [Chloroflexota bacterium]MBM3165852.1 DUF2007 domain-containing protein [Chloroflexota bacterium]MBM3172901.1 DUF2007 domain-containing protein [Chloroflexota bacterium]MBM4449286.1 DUF2007 domain-containing protein [Chloroflexota bacterium]